jgi:putative dimethyl sulfoxide reductase chaperone
VTKSSQIDWQERLTGEMLLLNMLGRMSYTYPTSDERTWLQSLIDQDIFSEAPFAAEQDQVQVGLKVLQKWGENDLTDERFEDLQADYTRLFIGPGKVIAPPWESVYFNDERLTFQEQTLDVRNWYGRFGLESEKKYQEPDDHIGLQLLFLSHLAGLGLQALNEQEDVRFTEVWQAQREFHQQHTRAWALTWCELVEANARTDFYKGLAYLVRGAVLELSEMLKVEQTKEVAR